jgi:hypothetical protein
VPQQQPGEPGAHDEYIALVGERLAGDGWGGVDVGQVAGELAVHRREAGRAPAGVAELAVAGLCLVVEHRTRRQRRQGLARLVGLDGVAGGVDAHRCGGGTCCEPLQPGDRIHPHRHRSPPFALAPHTT